MDEGPQHRAGLAGRSAAMAVKICWNRARGTTTSAIWNEIDRPWRTILGAITALGPLPPARY
jgi:hypothetical protein